jgi:hypothetical protein
LSNGGSPWIFLSKAAPGGVPTKRLTKPAFDDAGNFLGVLVMDCDLTPVVDFCGASA